MIKKYNDFINENVKNGLQDESVNWRKNETRYIDNKSIDEGFIDKVKNVALGVGMAACVAGSPGCKKQEFGKHGIEIQARRTLYEPGNDPIQIVGRGQYSPSTFYVDTATAFTPFAGMSHIYSIIDDFSDVELDILKFGILIYYERGETQGYPDRYHMNLKTHTIVDYKIKNMKYISIPGYAMSNPEPHKNIRETEVFKDAVMFIKYSIDNAQYFEAETGLPASVVDGY